MFMVGSTPERALGPDPGAVRDGGGGKDQQDKRIAQ
jgi:hypothetical protein